MSYYSAGEKVRYVVTGDYATILKALPNDEYVIEFDNNQLVPPQMTVSGSRLSPIPINLFGGYDLEYFGQQVFNPNKETHCPKCGNLWKKTESFISTFYDCINCNLKREDVWKQKTE